MKHDTVVSARIKVAGALALACALAFSSRAQADWSTFQPSGGGFTVALPGQPAHQHQTQAVSGGQADSDLWLLRTGSEVYAIGVTAYSMNVDVQNELAADRDNFDKGVNATPTSQRAVSENGIAGVDVVSENASQRFHMRWFSDGHRAWGAVIGMPIGSFDPGLADRFLSSFELTSAAN